MKELNLSIEVRKHLFAAFLKSIGQEGVKRYLKYVAATECGTQVISDEYDLSVEEALHKLRHMGKQGAAPAEESCVVQGEENKEGGSPGLLKGNTGIACCLIAE